MNIVHGMIAFAAVLCSALLAPSQAEPAHIVAGNTNVRGGPGMSFPVTTRVPGGTSVEVTGCVTDFSWCDVIIEDVEGSLRGWISSTRLEFSHAGQLVPLWSFHTFFNVPIIDGSSRYEDRTQSPRGGRIDPNCSDPNVLCPDEGPVECEACPWPTGRAP
jgi:uncharacterized protein YraI